MTMSGTHPLVVLALFGLGKGRCAARDWLSVVRLRPLGRMDTLDRARSVWMSPPLSGRECAEG